MPNTNQQGGQNNNLKFLNSQKPKLFHKLEFLIQFLPKHLTKDMNKFKKEVD